MVDTAREEGVVDIDGDAEGGKYGSFNGSVHVLGIWRCWSWYVPYYYYRYGEVILKLASFYCAVL
jgi:hypothetical protein